MVLDKFTNFKVVDEKTIHELKSYIKYEAFLNEDEIFKINWIMKITDSNEIYDSDANALASAMTLMNCKIFFVLPTVLLLNEKCTEKAMDSKEQVAYFFSADKEGVEDFQKIDWISLNFNTCVIFDSNLSFLVLRTGTSAHLIYAGTKEFIKVACSANDYWLPYLGIESKTW